MITVNFLLSSDIFEIPKSLSLKATRLLNFFSNFVMRRKGETKTATYTNIATDYAQLFKKFSLSVENTACRLRFWVKLM